MRWTKDKGAFIFSIQISLNFVNVINNGKIILILQKLIKREKLIKLFAKES